LSIPNVHLTFVMIGALDVMLVFGYGESISFILTVASPDSFVTPSHMVGPGELVDVGKKALFDHEEAAFETGKELAKSNGIKTRGLPLKQALDLSLTRIRMTRVRVLKILRRPDTHLHHRIWPNAATRAIPCFGS